MKKIELLSPAGDLERLKVTLLYGADAVYLGGKLYNLRANATNFSLEDLKSELDSYTDLDDTHKKMALRIFELKDREFEKVHEKQARNRIQGE